MSGRDPQHDLERAEQAFREALGVLRIRPESQTPLLALAGSWAKAKAVWAVAQLVRGGTNTSPGPN